MAIVPVKDGEITVLQIVLFLLLYNFINNSFRFSVIVICLKNLDFFTFGVGCPDCFGNLLDVVFNHIVGGSKNVPGRTVVLFQLV